VEFGPASPDAGLTEQITARLAQRATSLTPAEISRVAATIVREARGRDLEPWLVMAVIEVESNFDAFAASPVGALGLMQILPTTGEALARRAGISWRGGRTLFDPVVNVRLGVAYLQQLRARFGQLETALAAYNWGPGAIGRRMRAGAPLPEGYVRRVLAVREKALPLTSAS
jgi:soluble lytic murein transglycosylase